ncbi:O-antigen ligase like membrane protein [Micromonospora echinaurantiaca]|uniref:O-antigen ligase like membrane protein n=1 Tax=Micromonospora echinaurantiaca TaxID=47857 RepID=A0A1C5JNF2_9ACTN|nr:O-antigen ligase family protein [Micromonospora echinaurantiaca]SCG72124.1 O-antigen ligase like membrane protein [Micromonospora echinaurantiaca]
MTASVRALGLPAVLALTVGVLASWHPVLLAVLGLAALLVWGLWTPSRLMYALFAVLLLVPVTADPGYPTEPVWVVLLAATAIALFGRIQRFDPDRPLASVGMAGFVLPVTGVVAGLVHWHGPKTLIVSLIPFVCYAVIGWHVVEEARRDPELVKRVATAVAWLGVPIALLAVYQRASGTWPVLDALATSNAFTSSGGAGRSVGTIGHPIVYGTYCMMSMCVTLALRGRLWQVPFAAGAVGLLLSGSRSAWIGMAGALLVWYLSQERKVTRRGVGLVAAFVAAGGVLVLAGPGPVRGAVDILRSRLSNVTGSSSATARYSRYDVAWSGLWDRVDTVLFGLGPEAHVRYFQQVGIGDFLAQTFDNSYLTLWYDFGLIALLPFVAILVALFVKSRSLAARMLVAAMAAQIFFFDFYLWPCAAAVLILAAGLAISPGRRNGTQQGVRGMAKVPLARAG